MSASEPRQPPRSDSLVDLLQLLASRPRLVLVYPFVLALLVLAATFLLHPLYTSSVAFVPERLSSSGTPTSLSGLAGEFGINILTDVSRSAGFYVSVLESRQLKEQVLETPFRDSVPLLKLIAGDIPKSAHARAESVAAGVRWLTDAMRTSIDPHSGIIRLAVETPSPDLSAAIAMRFVELLNRFNASQRQSQARERRKFIESRISVAERGMREAEDGLRRFYQSNPSWSQRPTLVLEAERLRTSMDGARDAYLTLQREYELARIEEVNETPVLTIVDPAVPPLIKSYPRRRKIFASALVVFILLGAFSTLVLDYVTRARAQDPDAFRWRRR